MMIKRVRIENFRCIREEELEFNNITALIGANGCGKSSFLRALHAFYDGPMKLSEDDFFGRSVHNDASISVTFNELSDLERDLYRSYINDGTLTVKRTFTNDPSKVSGRYYAARLQNPSFSAVRNASSAGDKKREYRNLLEGEYRTLVPWTNQMQALAALDAWELAQPDRCEWLLDEGQFFGFSGVGKGNLARHTRFIYVPAVRDAADDVTESRSSPITMLFDFLVRNTFEKNAQIEHLKNETQEKYATLTKPESILELSHLATDLSSMLQHFYPQTGVKIVWQPPSEIILPLLKADVFLREDGFEARVSHMGHGLQRAFILAILQHLAFALNKRAEEAQVPSANPEADSAQQTEVPPTLSNLILAIEEPELYQHPSRQRHLARVLRSLTEQGYKGLNCKVQIVYSTHSPHFLNLEKFTEVRRVAKCSDDDRAATRARIIQANVQDIVDNLQRATEAMGRHAGTYTFGSLVSRLHIMNSDINEGFFSDLAILVEGVDDRAAIQGAAEFMNIDLEAENIALINCNGKWNLDRPLEIFRSLEIPTYIIWDGDVRCRGTKEERKAIDGNHLLLSLQNEPLTDWPFGVYDRYAVFHDNLEEHLSAEIGSQYYEGWFVENASRYGYGGKREAQKNPKVLRDLLRDATGDGRSFPMLHEIVDRALALKGRR